MTTATAAEIARTPQESATPDLAAQRFWRELYLAEAQAYWRRKAPGAWPTEQNGKLVLEGKKFQVQPYAEFVRQLALRIRTFCNKCESLYPCSCGGNHHKRKDPNRSSSVRLEDLFSAA